MATTLLTLSRQHAAGKISTAAYRSQRRQLIDGQMFQLEEQTQPGFVKEAEMSANVSGSDITQPTTNEGQLSDQAMVARMNLNPHSAMIPEPSQPVPQIVPSIADVGNNAAEPVQAKTAETTTVNTRERLGNLSKPKYVVHEPKHVSSKKLLLGLLAGFVAMAVLIAIMLFTREQRIAPAVEDVLVNSTQSLLDNPDWQLGDLKIYRIHLKGQQRQMIAEQHALLDSVNLYLSVPFNGEGNELDREVLLLKQELETLKSIQK